MKSFSLIGVVTSSCDGDKDPFVEFVQNDWGLGDSSNFNNDNLDHGGLYTFPQTFNEWESKCSQVETDNRIGTIIFIESFAIFDKVDIPNKMQSRSFSITNVTVQ